MQMQLSLALLGSEHVYRIRQQLSTFGFTDTQDQRTRLATGARKRTAKCCRQQNQCRPIAKSTLPVDRGRFCTDQTIRKNRSEKRAKGPPASRFTARASSFLRPHGGGWRTSCRTGDEIQRSIKARFKSLKSMHCSALRIISWRSMRPYSLVSIVQSSPFAQKIVVENDHIKVIISLKWSKRNI